MLTADLVDARIVRDKVKPIYVDWNDPDVHAAAELVIDAFARGVGKPRGDLEAELKQLGGVRKEYLFRRGLAKLMFDRCEFATRCPMEPQDLRRLVFERAAKAHVEAGPLGLDPLPLLESIGAELGMEAVDLTRALYADLKEEEIVASVDLPTPRALLHRYDLALAQAVLLKATRLEISIPKQKLTVLRALFRAIKFHRLMHEVTRDDEGGFSIVLDGPLSLFQAAAKYGVSMALFLPSLLHCDGFELEAEVQWGRARAIKRFQLSSAEGLVTEQRLTGQYQPEELSWFLTQFRKLDSEFDVSDDPEVIDVDGGAVIIPDFVFVHRRTGRSIAFEVFGPWRRGALESRLKRLSGHRQLHLLLGVGRDLRVDASAHDGVPENVYVFRSVPIAREVLARLNAFVEPNRRP